MQWTKHFFPDQTMQYAMHILFNFQQQNPEGIIIKYLLKYLVQKYFPRGKAKGGKETKIRVHPKKAFAVQLKKNL